MSSTDDETSTCSALTRAATCVGGSDKSVGGLLWRSQSWQPSVPARMKPAEITTKLRILRIELPLGIAAGKRRRTRLTRSEKTLHRFDQSGSRVGGAKTAGNATALT